MERQRHHREVLSIEAVIEQRGLEEHAYELAVGPLSGAELTRLQEPRRTVHGRIVGLPAFDQPDERPCRLYGEAPVRFRVLVTEGAYLPLSPTAIGSENDIFQVNAILLISQHSITTTLSINS